ncbi:MAG TPA: dihydrolipoyl dehydrogenase [bacterium]|nr:dihydrolipoyl dehydrogenase [bacterium]HMZ04047.1 dihydrolipoyl dehydrogenase [bacterium]HNB08124.1 dihydrolipoyl dehydrogenase [bacterium]HNB56067.1 dihydrolipoyl dehydrogenase [bacterium]HNC47391.1 dihydrolipoyl dehydrogenase [bacterium]
METKNFDVVVLGGGPGGYVAAIKAAQLGFKTAVVEREKIGGVCVNIGCIPTKALLKNAEMYEHMKHAAEWGYSFDNLKYDYKAIIKRSRDVADANSKGGDFLMKKNKIEVIKGTGKFLDKSTLSVADATGKETTQVKGKHIIIATGARARMLPNLKADGKRILTSTEAMTNTEQPKSIVIIGAGAIGIEFAYFFNTFGTKVTVVEMMPTILPVEDEEVSNTLLKVLQKKGMDIHTDTKVEKVDVGANNVTVTVSSKGKTQTITADQCLVAIGVQGNTENIGLEKIGVTVEKGWIKVDEYYRTNVQGVYAIGDIIGAPWLAHVASHEGIVCVEKMAGKDTHPIDYSSIPGCTYCQPQVGSIGLTEKKAREKGYDIKVGKFPFSASGKARAIGERDGFVKVIFDAKYGELLGAHILGSEATEMIAEYGIAKSLESTYKEIGNTIHAHPTLSEAMMEAALDAYKEAVHI